MNSTAKQSHHCSMFNSIHLGQTGCQMFINLPDADDEFRVFELKMLTKHLIYLGGAVPS